MSLAASAGRVGRASGEARAVLADRRNETVGLGRRAGGERHRALTPRLLLGRTRLLDEDDCVAAGLVEELHVHFEARTDSATGLQEWAAAPRRWRRRRPWDAVPSCPAPIPRRAAGGVATSAAGPPCASPSRRPPRRRGTPRAFPPTPRTGTRGGRNGPTRSSCSRDGDSRSPRTRAAYSLGRRPSSVVLRQLEQAAARAGPARKGRGPGRRALSPCPGRTRSPPPARRARRAVGGSRRSRSGCSRRSCPASPVRRRPVPSRRASREETYSSTEPSAEVTPSSDRRSSPMYSGSSFLIE